MEAKKNSEKKPEENGEENAEEDQDTSSSSPALKKCSADLISRPGQQEQTTCTTSTSSPQSRNVAVVRPRLASQSWRLCTIERRVNSLPYARATELENNNLEEMRIVEIRGEMISQVGERLVNLGHF